MKYTIGEIFRNKMLITKDGQPFKDKASVSNVLRRYPCEVKETPHGSAKLYSQETIDAVNNRWS